MNEGYSFKKYLKDDWDTLVRIYCGASWGFMTIIAGMFILEHNSTVSALLIGIGTIWLVIHLFVTRVRCFP